MAAIRRSNSSAIGKLLLDGKYSDLVLTCRGAEFRVHRAIVCTQSPYLARRSDFLVASQYDDHQRALDLPEERPEILAKLLEWLYTGDVHDPDFFDAGPPPRPGSPCSSSRSTVVGGLGFQLAIAGIDHAHDPLDTPSHPHLPRRHHSVQSWPSTWTPSPLSASSSPSPWAEWATIAAVTPSLTPAPTPTIVNDDTAPVDKLYDYLRLHVAADRFGIPPLARLAADRWERIVRGSWPTVAHWAADRRAAPLLAELFSTAPRGGEEAMRALACDLVATCYARARGNVCGVMMLHPEFAVGVLDRVAGVRAYADLPP